LRKEHRIEMMDASFSVAVGGMETHGRPEA
jgi:hypothetical protein